MTFLFPELLILIPIVWLIQIALYAHAYFWNKRKFHVFTQYPEAQKLVLHASPVHKILRETFFSFAIISMIIALARPQWGTTTREVATHGIDIIFALDTSRSMLADDIKPNRLERAKFIIAEFSEQMKGGDRVGLVAFAGRAFLQCPLTLDYDAFRQSLDAVDTTIISQQGTDIATALSEAENAFASTQNTKIVILLTDGEDLEESGVQKAKSLAKDKIKIYTVGIGSAQGSFIPILNDRGKESLLRDANNNVVQTKLDEATLHKIAENSDAMYIPFSSAEVSLMQVYNENAQKNTALNRETDTQEVGIERFQLFLAIAFLFLLLEPMMNLFRRFRSPSILSLLIVVLFAISEPQLHAQEQNAIQSEESPAQETAISETNDLPEPDFKSLTEKADAAFRAKNYKDAENFYSQAEKLEPGNAQVLYNLANACYRQEKYTEAKAYYEKALKTADITWHAKIFYNLANTAYKIGEKDFKSDPESIIPIKENIPTLITATDDAIAFAKNVLALKAVQRRKEAWQRCEKALENVTAFIQANNDALGKNSAVPDSWQDAHQYYLAAQDLQSPYPNALENDEILTQKTEGVSDNFSFLSQNKKLLNDYKTQLKHLIEELKKPTPEAIELKSVIDGYVTAGKYNDAVQLYEATLPRDPTVEIYQESIDRIKQLAEIKPQ